MLTFDWNWRTYDYIHNKKHNRITEGRAMTFGLRSVGEHSNCTIYVGIVTIAVADSDSE